MNNYFIFLFLVISITSQAQKKTDLELINEVMQQQQDAWNRADIDAFMEGYWKSDSLQFISHRGVSYGWQTTMDNYKKSYPTAEAMGTLTFTIIKLEQLSPTSAFMIGQWRLKRENDEPGGHFTLLWRKIKGKWVIVADHTS